MSMNHLNLMNMQQAIDYLGVSRSTIDRWRKEKNLPFVKIGKEVLIDKKYLDSWIRSFLYEQQENAIVQIGYQSGTAHMWTGLLMKEMGFFEEELQLTFQNNKWKVNWYNASSGLELVELMIKGKIHIASLGDYPMTICQELSQILPNFSSVILAFDGKTENGKGISLVTSKENKINSIEDLSYAPISTVTNSSAEVRLPYYLTSLSAEFHPEIVHKKMNESMESINQRCISASVMWEPYPSLMNYYGTGRIMKNEVKVSDYLTGIVSENSWLLKNEGVAISYLKAHIRSHQLMRNNLDKAARILATATNIPVEVVTRVVSKVRWDSCIYDRDINTLKNFRSNIRKPQSNYVSHNSKFLIKMEYLQTAIDELNLPLLQSSLIRGEWKKELIY
ncbi:helix-turn-helix domain-containing protein [Metabacillus fastidiosus]|uniref:helix-turn-helix domain-containing protein n=1 Tax=Metabacillus fastidiosus TaxID=1458 RepID=UPI002DB5CD74|nr:helix-turn-helix domain-containing protein [Metabacillus fastidiosus]MEC2077392.1 helix-turn-helix domain-containing protein [Metabacillus fastidiosus]